MREMRRALTVLAVAMRMAAAGGCGGLGSGGAAADLAVGAADRDGADSKGGGELGAAPDTADGSCSGSLPSVADAPPGPAWTGGFERAPNIEASLIEKDAAPWMALSDFSSVLVLDTDGDGRQDLVYNHVDVRRSWLIRQTAPGQFVNQGVLPAGSAQCMFAADLDGDGATDVFCSAATPRVVWGGPAGIDWNGSTWIGASDPNASAAAAWDLDEDGLLDIVIGPWGPAKIVYRNRGDRSFEDVSTAWRMAAPGLTWQTAFFDFDHDGRADVWEMHDGDGGASLAFHADGPGPDGEPRFSRMQPLPAACDGDGLFTFGPSHPMGVAMADLAGSGARALYLGLTQSQTLLVEQPGGSWLDAAPRLGLGTPLTSTGQIMVRWSPLFWDLDHDGLIDLLVLGGDDAGHGMGMNRGLSHSLVYHARQVFQFEEIHASAGLGATGNFMSVYPADLDGDGELDLCVGGFGQPPAVYLNRVGANGHHLLLSLHGQVSNAAGLGAEVQVSAGSLHRTYFAGDHYGPQVTPAPVLDIGTGAATQIDELRIRWPSGYRQRLSHVPTGGTRRIDEPRFITVLPVNRHVRADGASTVTISVRPVDEDGALQATSAVTIESPFMPAANWTGPATSRAGVTARTLLAPDKKGSVVVQVSIDGKPVGVRPRVWFD